MGYPNDAVVCYMGDCNNPALIWLDEVAARDYDKGERLFLMMGGAVRIRLQ